MAESDVTLTLTYGADGAYTWTVPDAVQELILDLYGAGGSSGAGGRTQGTLSATPGETLEIRVGGQASGRSGGYNGGGDGGESSGDADDGQGGHGASDVRQGGTALSDRVAVAGGAGGNSGGGDGGYPEGTDGADNDGTGGTGGTQSSGGTGANDGSLGTGGDGSGGYNNPGGGGGGGGYYGGGGGVKDSSVPGTGGAGGGGSSTVDTAVVTNESFTTGANADVGSVALTFDLALSVTTGYRSADLSVESVPDAEEYVWYRNGAEVGRTSTATYTDSELTPQTTYDWSVAVVVDGIETDRSGVTTATTGGAAPTDLTLAIADDAELTWTDTNDDEDGYEIHRATEAGVDTSGTPLATTGANETQYVDTNALDGEHYYYRVVAVQDGERGLDSAERDGETDLPAPTDLVHGDTGDETIPLSWTSNANNGSQRVEYRPAGEGASWQTHQSGLALETESATVDGLHNGEEYELRVGVETEHVTTYDAS